MLEVFVMTLIAVTCPIEKDAKCEPFRASLVRADSEFTNRECQDWANTLVDVAASEDNLHFVPERCLFTRGIYLK